jgi:hypothetical protein
MPGSRQPAAVQSSAVAAGQQHGDIQSILQLDEVAGAHAIQEGTVLVVAAQEHVLACVSDESAVVQAAGLAAESRTAFQQPDSTPALGQPDGGRDAGEAAANHDNVGH